MKDLNINTGEVKKILVDFIQTETSRNGYSRAVLGVSGGLDSALACFLATKALGSENVLALILPYKESSPESLLHAQMVVDQLGVESLNINITDMVEPYFRLYPDMSQVRRGNVLARQRMIILYDHSEKTRGLVVGTGNKSEIYLGYSTLYGDSACAFNPLGDLYKTQVRQLPRDMGVPAEIIEKPPSADLWKGQTDEGELGFTYEEVDKLLFMLIDQGCKPKECIEAGFPADFVKKVIGRINRYQFKRVMPPIAKISNRSSDSGLLHFQD